MAPTLRLVQAGTDAPGSTGIIRLTRPAANQAIVVHLEGPTTIDLAAIAGDRIVLVQAGDRLIVLFDNQATVTLAPAFGDDGRLLGDLTFLVDGRSVGGPDFAALVPITTDQSVLPAEGNGSPTSAAHFVDPTIDPLAGFNPLPLLGPETPGGVAVSVQGGINTVPVIGSPDTGLVDDEGLSEGIIGGPGDVPGEPLVFTGSLDVDFGQDLTGRSLTFNGSQPGLSGYTSGGQPISVTFGSIGGLPALIAYVGASPDPAHQVFTISLDIGPLQGAYTVTLLQPFDHPIADIEDSLVLAISFRATDGNGDFADGVFRVIVNDDTPELGLFDGEEAIGPEGAIVDEDDLSIAQGDTVNGRSDAASGDLPTITNPALDTDADGSTVAGSLNIRFGADRGNSVPDGGSSAGPGDRAVTFAHLDDAAANVQVAYPDGPLTSRGEAVTFELAGNNAVLIARAGDRVVFTVTLSDTGSGAYRFDLNDVLDHPGHGTEDVLDLTFSFTFSDADGDTGSGAFSVLIDDDSPVVLSPERGMVDEDGLPAGVGDSAPGDAADQDADGDGNEATVTGALGIAWGADDANRVVDGGFSAGNGDRAVVFDQAGTVPPAGLTSNGVAVDSYTVSADGRLLTASTSDGEVVFTVHLSDQGAGAYTFTLLRNLDHGDPDSEDDLDLTFGFIATDSDGDAATGRFTVSVDDDTPAMSGASLRGQVDETSLIPVPADPQTIGFDGASGADFSITGNISAGHATVGRLGADLVVTHAGGTPFVLGSVLLQTPLGFPQSVTITGRDANGNVVAQATVSFPHASSVTFGPGQAGYDAFAGQQVSALDFSSFGYLIYVDNLALEVGGAPGTPPVDLQDLSTLVAGGADTPATFALKSVDVQDIGGVTALGGHPVKVVSDGQILTGFVDSGAVPDLLDAGDTVVFTVTVSPQGMAAFTLFEGVDQNFGPRTEVDLGPFIEVTDGDGDTVALGPGVYGVGVDAPVSGRPPDANDDPDVIGQPVTIITTTAMSNGTPIQSVVSTAISNTAIEDPTSGIDIGSGRITFTATSSGFASAFVTNLSTPFHITSAAFVSGDFVPQISLSNGQLSLAAFGVNFVAGSTTFTVSYTTDAVIDVDVLSTTGNLHDLLLANDVDPDGDPIDIVAVDTTGTLGSVFFDDLTNTLTYTASGVSVVLGQTVYDSFTYTVTDRNGGIDTATVTFAVTNQTPAVIDGEDTGAVVEDTVLTASGILTVVDPDAGQSAFVPEGSLAGSYGTLAIDAAGHWTYTLDNTRPAVQGLASGQSLTDQVTVQSLDGTSHVVTITIDGRDEPPAMLIGEVTEDATRIVLSPQLVTNGGFEALFDGWATDHFQAFGTVSHTGLVSVGVGRLSVSDGSGHGVLSQDIATVPGATYRVGFWASNAFDSPPGSPAIESLTVTWGGSAILSLADIPASGAYDIYTYYEFDVTATGTVTTLQFDATDTWDYWLFDDISVRPTMPAGAEVTAGSFAFTDGTLGNVHSVSSTPLGVGYYGTLTAVVSDPATGDGAGTVTWTYSVDDADIQFLADGQTITQSYAVTVDDGHGNLTSRTVEILLHGANDAPVASAIDAGTASEGDAVQVLDLLAGQSDPDHDPLTVVNIAVTDDLGHAVSFTDNLDGSISIDPAQYAALGLGDSRTLTVAYDLSDGLVTTPNSATLVITGAAGPVRTRLVGPGADDEVIVGTVGDDVLVGGAGHDTLTGGAGADRFVYAESGSAHVDEILDYSFGEGDVLDLSALLDATFGPGSDVADFVRVQDQGGGVYLVQVDTDGAGGTVAWSDVAVLHSAAGNQVLADFESQVHQLTAA